MNQLFKKIDYDFMFSTSIIIRCERSRFSLVVTVMDTPMVTYALKMKQPRGGHVSAKEILAGITVKCVVRYTIRNLGLKVVMHHGKLTLELLVNVSLSGNSL